MRELLYYAAIAAVLTTGLMASKCTSTTVQNPDGTSTTTVEKKGNG
jgi:hypothetical protein